MKVALGILTRNEEFYLGRHLPIIANSFDGIVAVDAASVDRSVEILTSFGAKIENREWNNDFGAARNAMIALAEREGYDWIFMVDSDECMFPKDIETVKEYMPQSQFIALPRIEFVRDYYHFDHTLYPDFQGRVFKLHQGFHYRNKVHEMLYKPDDDIALMSRLDYRVVAAGCHLYHYSRCKSPESLWLKYANYDRLMKGEELIERIPDGTRVNLTDFWKSEVEFHGPQPVY